MRSIQELAAAANITDTATTQITEFQQTQFAKDIQLYQEDFRYMQNAVNINKDLVGTRDNAVRLFFTTSHLSVTKTHTEGDERTYTELTNLDSVTVTPTWDLGAIAISKEIATTASVDLIELAKTIIAEDGEKQVEAAIVTALEGVTTNAVFGGDATSVASLETGDKITPELVTEAKGLLRNADGKPFIVAIHPEQETELTRYSQFMNVDEYGGREVTLNGEIGKFNGFKVIVTTNINQKTNAQDSWGATGHQCIALAQNKRGQNAATLCWKEMLTYSYEYLPRFANHYVYRDASYAVGIVQDSLACLLNVTDA